ncbi:MAG: GIY-YIG nuclease family protein [Endomicrobia bacterium]|nr:GIY-YIG nuclease family protein [Endomicrobiia bacterium]MCL2506139.1 GIY-YIG nuclease family protein [Endomicrobiia bacterium]
MRNYCVYIMASKKDGVMYIGITNDIARRVYEHKEGLVPGFTKKYKVNKLVYAEMFNNVTEAIEREKQLKGWRREKKILLIETSNKSWSDLYKTIL